MSQSSGFTEPLYLGVSLGSENPLGKGSSRMRGPKHGGPTSSSSSNARDRARRSIQWRASFSPTPSRRPRRSPSVGWSTGGGDACLSLQGGGGGGQSSRRSTALGRPSWSRSMVIRVRLRLAAGSGSLGPRAPPVGVREIAPCSRRGGGSRHAGRVPPCGGRLLVARQPCR